MQKAKAQYNKYQKKKTEITVKKQQNVNLLPIELQQLGVNNSLLTTEPVSGKQLAFKNG